MKPIHVVHVFESLLPGGAERQGLLLVRASDRVRFRHSVVNYCPLPGDLTQAFAEAGCEVHCLEKRRLGSVRFLLALRSLLRRLRPDVVHAWLYSPSFWGRVAALSGGLRGIVASARNGEPYRHAYEGVLDRLLSRGTDARVVNALGVKDLLVHSVGIPETQVRVIYNGIDGARLAPTAPREVLRQRFGWPPETPVLLGVGRLVTEKDFPLLLRAVGRLRPRHPDLRLVIAGWGELQSQLEALRASLGLGDAVAFLGRREDVSDLLAACDIFVSTSASEGFSNALLEALWAGVPVVSTRVNGAVEILCDRENALVVDVGDEAAVSTALETLLEDLPLRERLGRAGAATVRQRFSVTAMVRDHEALYAEVARRHARSG